MLTLAPQWLTCSVARTASARWVPATNRPEKRRPRAEFSAKWRIDLLSESLMKVVLSMLPPRARTAEAQPKDRYKNDAYIVGDCEPNSR